MNRKIPVITLFIMLLCVSISTFVYYTDIVEATWTVWDGPPDPNTYGDDFFTVVVIPDTQDYAKTSAGGLRFQNMTQWIVDHQDDWNIEIALHVGDIIDSGNTGLGVGADQWARANDSMMTIYDADIPYGFVAGNHDMYPYYNGTWIAENYKAFDHAYLSTKPWWGNDTDDLGYEEMNNYQSLTLLGMDFIFMNLQYMTPETVLEWAADVVSNNPDTRFFVTTHSWIYPDGTKVIWDWAENLYHSILLKPYENIFFLSCGHVTQTENPPCPAGNVPAWIPGNITINRSVEPGWTGNTNTYYMVRNWQGGVVPYIPNDGDGWFTLLTFYPSRDQIHVQTYSSTLGKWEDPHWTGSVYSGNTTQIGMPYEHWLDYDMEPEAETNISQFILIDGKTNDTTIETSIPIFNWDVIDDAITYNLQIATDSSFSNIITNLADINKYNYPTKYSETGSNASFTLPNANALSSFDTYYFRVRAYT